MCRRVLFISALLWLAVISGLSAQANLIELDTFNIYEDSTLYFRIYKKQWFGGEYGFSHNKCNKQDSIVLLNNEPKYIKVFLSGNRLWFESAVTDFGQPTGEISYYDKHGTISRIEYYNKVIHFDSCPDSSSLEFETPMRNGTWKYFDKSGKLRKERKFAFVADGCNFDYKVYQVITKYNESGMLRSTLYRRVFFWYYLSVL